MLTTEITLRIRYYENDSMHPRLWRWDDLLDLWPKESVEIVGVHDIPADLLPEEEN